MHAPLRDLASVEVWEKSLERSRRRRVLAAQGRREMARRKQASAAVSAAMVVSPSAAAFAAAGNGPGSGSSGVAGASAANRAIAPGSPSSLLRVGSQGPDVVRIQSALGQAPDGVFGSRTEAAVRVFQSRNGLLVDGIVGPQTWRVLFGPHGASYDAATPKYQFQIQRATKVEEAKVRPALAGQGPVAKIVLRSTPSANEGVKQHRHATAQAPAAHAHDAIPHTTPAVDHSPPATPHTVSAPEPAAPVSTSCGSSRIVAPVKHYTVTGDFGEQRPGHLHAGIDLAAPMGTPIVAAACGVVTTAGVQSGYGNIVCIRHSSSLTTCYAHLSRFASHVGQEVHQGQVIGYVGMTGDATGPHVHFETRVHGTPVDPAPYLSGSRRVKTSHSASAAGGSSSSSAKRDTSGSSGTQTASSASGPGAGASGSTKGGSTAKPTAAGPGASTGGTAAPEQQAAPAEQGTADQSTAEQPAETPPAATAPAPAAAPAPEPAHAAAP